jgi:hypothetical protein
MVTDEEEERGEGRTSAVLSLRLELEQLRRSVEENQKIIKTLRKQIVPERSTRREGTCIYSVVSGVLGF